MAGFAGARIGKAFSIEIPSKNSAFIFFRGILLGVAKRGYKEEEEEEDEEQKEGEQDNRIQKDDDEEKPGETLTEGDSGSD